jgi:hypothetical protein
LGIGEFRTAVVETGAGAALEATGTGATDGVIFLAMRAISFYDALRQFQRHAGSGAILRAAGSAGAAFSRIIGLGQPDWTHYRNFLDQR